MTSERLRDAVASFAEYRAAKAEPVPDLFSVIASVTEHAGEVWRLEALRAVEEVARRHAEFTVEDVSPLIGACYDRRAIGAVLLEAKRRGWCTQLGWVSGGAGRHGRAVRLWASLIYEGPNRQ